MNYQNIIHEEWKKAFAKMSQTSGFARMLSGEVTVENYKELMRQIFHHARENPQIQTLAAVYFRGDQRQMVKPFFKHATSEIGHDQLALDDLKTLGVDVSEIPTEKPLTSTTALLSYAFYQIQFRNPIGYLGYLYHLEFMPTTDGAKYMASFEKAGVPRSAMTFIHDHVTIDMAHNKLMLQYIDTLVKTPQELDAVVYATEVTADLYGKMVTQAFEVADQGLRAQMPARPSEETASYRRRGETSLELV